MMTFRNHRMGLSRRRTFAKKERHYDSTDLADAYFGNAPGECVISCASGLATCGSGVCSDTCSGAASALCNGKCVVRNDLLGQLHDLRQLPEQVFREYPNGPPELRRLRQYMRCGKGLLRRRLRAGMHRIERDKLRRHLRRRSHGQAELRWLRYCVWRRASMLKWCLLARVHFAIPWLRRGPRLHLRES